MQNKKEVVEGSKTLKRQEEEKARSQVEVQIETGTGVVL